MTTNYIALAIPVFLLLTGIELLAALITSKTHYYRLNDTINNLSVGILSRISEVFLKSFIAAGYLYLYANHRITSFSADSTAVWILCFLGVDLLYYWFHRMSHEVAVIWGAHIPHHQSEEYNLGVALRQGAFQAAFSWIFYLPLALLGFPVVMFITIIQLNFLYQFWIHTRFIGKLGPLEFIFNTPSHHRVHHGINPLYIDKNHGGTLIIWDKMFGTFREEKEPVVYGTVKPLESWNPLRANLIYWKNLFVNSMKLKGLDKLKIWFKTPGWAPSGMVSDESPLPVSPESFKKFDPRIPFGLNLYTIIHFTLIVAAFIYFVYFGGKLTMNDTIILSIFLTVSIVTIGWILEGRAFAANLEMARITAALAVFLLVYLPETAWGTAAFAAAMAGNLWLYRCNNELKTALDK